MPVEPNQQPFPGQRRYISTEREASTIPKGGTETTWVYPSPQMFYNGKPTRFLQQTVYYVKVAKLHALSCRYCGPGSMSCMQCDIQQLHVNTNVVSHSLLACSPET